ncbi:MAG: metalloregulator ArsR/SmtB family transcription factor [Pseudomonadota bacterium]
MLNRMVDDPEDRLDAVFAALADPTRRAILAALLDGDRSVGDLAAPFEMSLAAVSKHVAVLARAGLLRQDRAGRARICRLDPDAIAPAVIWMTAFGSVEADAFATLERFLEAELGIDPDEAGEAGPPAGDDAAAPPR